MKIYISKDSQQYGPYTIEQLRVYVQQGNFTTADLACCDGQNWVTVAQVPGFAAGGDSVTSPEQPQVVQEQAATTVVASKKKKIVLWSSIGGIAALLVIGLLVGFLASGGGEEAKDDPSVPLAIPCVVCGERVSKKKKECRECGHPIDESVVAYKEAQELARIRAEKERKRAEEERWLAAELRRIDRAVADALRPLTKNTLENTLERLRIKQESAQAKIKAMEVGESRRLLGEEQPKEK